MMSSEESTVEQPTNNGELLKEFGTACSEGQIDVVRQLWQSRGTSLDLEAPILEYNGFIATALMIASAENQVEIMRFLIETCQVDVERREPMYGDNALLFASYYGSLQALQYLVDECKGKLNDRNNGGMTPLMYACEQGRQEVVSYILQRPECKTPDYVNARMYNGAISALTFAVLSNREEIVRLLGSSEYCNVNITTVELKTPLMYAVQLGLINIVKYFVKEHEATNLYAQAYTGEDVLAFAGQNEELRQILVEARMKRPPIEQLPDSSAETIQQLYKEIDRLRKREVELVDEVNSLRSRCDELMENSPHVLGEEVKRLKRHREDERLCKICFTQEKNIVYFPCGHIAVCKSCSDKEHTLMLAQQRAERQCCICRARVTSVRQVYFN